MQVWVSTLYYLHKTSIDTYSDTDHPILGNQHEKMPFCVTGQNKTQILSEASHQAQCVLSHECKDG